MFALIDCSSFVASIWLFSFTSLNAWIYHEYTTWIYTFECTTFCMFCVFHCCWWCLSILVCYGLFTFHATSLLPQALVRNSRPTWRQLDISILNFKKELFLSCPSVLSICFKQTIHQCVKEPIKVIKGEIRTFCFPKGIFDSNTFDGIVCWITLILLHETKKGKWNQQISLWGALKTLGCRHSEW